MIKLGGGEGGAEDVWKWGWGGKWLGDAMLGFSEERWQWRRECLVGSTSSWGVYSTILLLWFKTKRRFMIGRGSQGEMRFDRASLGLWGLGLMLGTGGEAQAGEEGGMWAIMVEYGSLVRGPISWGTLLLGHIPTRWLKGGGGGWAWHRSFVKLGLELG